MASLAGMSESLVAWFKMKDMGKLQYCLEASIEQDEDRKCLWLHQKQYILNMLENSGLTEAKTISIADLSVKIEEEDGIIKGVNPITYQSIVGSLM